MKHYMKVKPNAGKTTDIKFDIAYIKGGINMFTYKQEKRGYYLIVTPVERDGIMEGFTAFSGTKVLLKEVARQSTKAFREATAIMYTALNGIILATLEEEQELQRELTRSLCDAMDHKASSAELEDISARRKVALCRVAILDVMQRNNLEFDEVG